MNIDVCGVKIKQPVFFHVIGTGGIVGPTTPPHAASAREAYSWWISLFLYFCVFFIDLQ